MPIPLSKLKAAAERERMKKMLIEWHGKHNGALEIISHDSPIKSLNDLNIDFMQQAIPKNVRCQIDLSSRWKEIVSPQFAALVSFSSLNDDGTLFLEVRHSAFLQEELLKSADLLIDRINLKLGENVCKKICFVPNGRNSLNRKKYGDAK